MRSTIQICFPAGKPPSEVRLFAAGKTATLKGPLVWNARSVAAVKTQWAKYARKFGFDFEHAATLQDGAPHNRIAAGWGVLDPRPDGLWVTNIEWTPRAAAQIAAKEWRYLSPELRFDTKTNEIIEVYKASLTNDPATLAPTPLVLSARPSPAQQSNKGLNMKNIKDMYQACSALLAACQAGAESEDPAVKEMCSALSEVLAPAASKLQEMMGPDAEAPASLSMLNEVFEAAQQVTGQKDGLVGALLGLSATAKLKVEGKKDAEKEEKAQLFGQILSARKAHPTDKDRFLKLSTADLKSYLKIAPVLVPGEEEAAVPATTLSAAPGPKALDAGEQASDVAALLAQVSF